MSLCNRERGQCLGSRTKHTYKWTLHGQVPPWNPLLPPLSVSPAASVSVATWVSRRKGKCSASRSGAPAASDSSHRSRFAHGGCCAKPGCAFLVLSTSRHRGAPLPSWMEGKGECDKQLSRFATQTKPTVFANCHLSAAFCMWDGKHRSPQRSGHSGVFFFRSKCYFKVRYYNYFSLSSPSWCFLDVSQLLQGNCFWNVWFTADVNAGPLCHVYVGLHTHRCTTTVKRE